MILLLCRSRSNLTIVSQGHERADRPASTRGEADKAVRYAAGGGHGCSGAWMGSAWKDPHRARARHADSLAATFRCRKPTHESTLWGPAIQLRRSPGRTW